MKIAKRSCLTSGIILISLVFAGNVFSDEKECNSFSGYIMVGGGYAAGEMALDDTSDDENNTIDSLSQSLKNVSGAFTLITGAANYTFTSTGTTISLGGETDGSGLSVYQYAGDLGGFGVGVNYSKEDVFKDPFLTGVKRSKTDKEAIGVNLSWSEIFETDISIEYSFSSIDIDEDLAGKRNKKLKRDGNVHSLGFGFGLFETDEHALSAGLSYEIGDIKGDSNAYKGTGLSLAHGFSKEKWGLETELSWAMYDYNKSHPEFNKTRHDNIWGIGTTYTYNQPFDFEKCFLKLGVVCSKKESNIDYFDSSDVITYAGVGYAF